MRQRCTGPLVYTIKSGVLFCFVLFVMRVMRFAAAGRNGACWVSTESPRRGGVRYAGFVAFRAPGTTTTNFEVFTGRKMGKMAKIREIPKKSHDPNPAEIMIFGATDDLLKIETWAKMH